MRKALSLVFAAMPVWAERIEFQGGLLKSAIAPTADYGGIVYRHDGFRIGAYTAPTAQGVVASYSNTQSPLLLEVGQRERSLENGFLFGNGAWLPWTRNFAFAEPTGVRAGYQLRSMGADLQYYQTGPNNLAAARIFVMLFDWLRLTGGIAVPELHEGAQRLPVASLALGRTAERKGFTTGIEAAGEGNYLLHARYRGDFSARGLLFRREQASPLASGIFEKREGFALQFFERHWFAQFFSTDSRFGMLRYGGDLLSGVVVYEERMQLAGLSVRSDVRGLHVRAGATVGHDTSLQSLLGLGFGDAVFVGGGHYELFSEQPLEPIIFPADWYSSVLLQSTTMRLRNSGFKLMALVDTKAVQGFVAATYSEDARGRERFDFYLRLAGGVTF
jgi:hypothetical protein